MTKASKIISTQRAALYIRVSTLYQADKDSLPMQREELTNYAKYALGVDNVEIFEDAGYSAKNTDRPSYQQMMARMRTGEFTHLVVWKIDRISRNLLDFAEMYEELKRIGVVFISKNEQFDTSTAIGEAMLKIILIFAELERKMTSERVTAVMLSRASSGQWNGGPIPFGYDYNADSKEFTINESEADIVHKIFDGYEEIKSLVHLTKTLNEKGYKTRRSNIWSPTTLSIILKNPFYIGVWRYNYYDETTGVKDRTIKSEDEWIVVPDHHPAIITLEQQNRVIASLEGRRRSNKESFKTYKRKHVHIFAGLLYCGSCGNGMQSNQDRIKANGYRPSIYSCSTRRKLNACKNKYVSDVTLGPFMMNYIANLIKAQNNFGRSTPLETFEKKLLRGNVFKDITGLEPIGLQETYDMLRSNILPASIFLNKYNAISDNENSVEIDLLASEKRKKERALIRLKNLYLYDEGGILSEKDYFIEYKSLSDEISKIDIRLEELEKNSSKHFSLTDNEFISMANFFIVSQNLAEKRFVNFEKLLKEIDTSVVKDFINSIVQKIVILDGKVMSIRFKNGLEHKFLYKQQ